MTNETASPVIYVKKAYRFFTSYKLAATLIVLLTIITLFGTLYQVDYGLHAAKQKYFYSLFILHDLQGLPIPLPGGILVMSLLFLNMFLGAIVKVRKRWRGAGLLISHFGMLMLLAGGFVTYAFATDGYMALYPGMKSDRVESYRRWQIDIMPLDEKGQPSGKVHAIPPGTLEKIGPNQSVTIPMEGLPFSVMVNGYARNATPVPTSAPAAENLNAHEVDGFKLSPQKPAKEAEQNLPGAYVSFISETEGEVTEAILWAGSYRFDPREAPMPFTFEVAGQRYAAMLAKKSWTVPFVVQLDEFIFERHPGVSTARNFESRITRFESGKPDQPLEIKMNEPMRYAGFVFFQESFGPPDGAPGEMFSQFAVANNPSDQWPLWALVITGFGLGIHFLIKLVEYSVRSQRKRTEKRTSSSEVPA